ncbi:DUF6191 domain-containing protein [Nocardia sp. NPDC050406]|uniref:DUF6191 domain-containing protein n=1 Tax=Nocardia sp. NPDC050406 TaxID=3364318 RepID=UPI0037A374B8
MIVAMTIPGLAILVIAVAFAEVTYRKITGRTGLPWMRTDEDRRAAVIGFEQFDAIFNSAKRVEFEQRQSVLMHRDNPGDGAPGGIDIDLSSGTARLRRP